MMRTMNSRIVILIIILLTPAWVISAPVLTLGPESTLSLTGDSTLHPFTSRTSQLQVTAEIDPSAGDPIPAILEKQALKHFDLTLPVKSLKSKESSLDKNMYKALKAEACPEISFHLSNYEVIKDTASAQTFHTKSAGTLKIACQELPVTLETDLTPGPGLLRVQGQYTLLMSAYGVKPPTMMMGTIKVKDQVVINYDLQLAPN
jgi:hypothetical protein